MSIQRYKWPVVIAAGLHGALFLESSQPALVRSALLPAETHSQRPQDEPSIQIDPPDPEEGAVAASASGGAALPELPERISVFSETTSFVQPIVERAPIKVLDGTLAEFSGRPGGDGIGWSDSAYAPTIDFSKLDRVPRATVQPSPDYPMSLRHHGISGSVMIEFEVNTEGRVVRATATAYTHREFVEPAVRAVSRWQFEPGKRNGRSVPFRMVIPIEFGLDGDRD